MSHEPETTTVLSFFTSGAGTWKRTLALGSDGAFSLPPEVVPPLLSSVPPVAPPELAVSSFLPSSLDEEYQTPPPMIRAIATTAATMIASCALNFLPPPGCPGCPGWGWSGMVPCG